MVYLEGGIASTRYSTDHEPIFRQESYFHYLFGVREPDVSGCVEIATGRATLFVPRLPEDYATVMGRIKTTEEIREEYGVDEVRYGEADEIERYLVEALERAGKKKKENGGENSHPESDGQSSSADADGGSPELLLLSGLNTDSGETSDPPSFPASSPLTPFLNESALHPDLAECRVVKSEAELSLLRHVTELSSFAHAYAMRATRPGMTEYQSESLFRHYCYYNGGARHLGYTAICGCGPSSAVLHYGHAGAPNDRSVGEGDLCLFDLGAEYCCYGSDVTCTFPASGTFDERQRAVYGGVLDAQRAVMEMLRSGTSWVDCHKAAEACILRALIGIGIVHPGEKTVEDLVDMRLGAVFMPNGLGHFIGIDTHDVGGYLPGDPPRIMEPGFRSLRTARIMRAGMVITVEPGCYFIDHLLDAALVAGSPLERYLDADLIDGHFRGFGGIRLEDVVAVTETGCVNFTLCPRTVDEVEAVKRGGKWPPVSDEAPELRRERLCKTFDTVTVGFAGFP